LGWELSSAERFMDIIARDSDFFCGMSVWRLSTTAMIVHQNGNTI
jgi:hypothetical protein